MLRRPKKRPNHTHAHDSVSQAKATQERNKHLALAKAAETNGDRITAERHLQYADHYIRLIPTNTNPTNQRHETKPSAEAKQESAAPKSMQDQADIKQPEIKRNPGSRRKIQDNAKETKELEVTTDSQPTNGS